MCKEMSSHQKRKVSKTFKRKPCIVVVNLTKENKALFKNTSSLRTMDPVLDSDGVTRAGGRKRKANLPCTLKNQVILPKSSHITSPIILVPRGRAPFGQHHQESRSLAPFGFEWLCKHNTLRPEPIRFGSENAQSEGKSVNCGLPVLDLARGHDSWC